jgi:hypothetical protein
MVTRQPLTGGIAGRKCSPALFIARLVARNFIQECRTWRMCHIMRDEHKFNRDLAAKISRYWAFWEASAGCSVSFQKLENYRAVHIVTSDMLNGLPRKRGAIPAHMVQTLTPKGQADVAV